MKKKKSKRIYLYSLFNSKFPVYIGRTKRLNERPKEHKSTKKFNKVRILGYSQNQILAKAMEAYFLEKFRRNHAGKNPKYNQTKNG